MKNSDIEHEVFIPKKFTKDHLEIIGNAAAIFSDYESQGFRLTLRQLYYQFVSMGFIENSLNSYKKVGSVINDARLAGLLSFDRMEDLERVFEDVYSQPDPYSVLNNIQYHYSEDYWSNQDVYIEVWVEKKALLNIVAKPCARLNVPYMACKGYMSSTAQWEAGKRFVDADNAGKRLLLLHLGDHDPSGLDMTRDNIERLTMFAGVDIEIRRLALNMEQIEEFNPPPNPTKLSDSRAIDYIDRFGRSSWELDALKPSIIADLITREVESHIDYDLWNEVEQKEEENRLILRGISDNAEEVFEFVRNL